MDIYKNYIETIKDSKIPSKERAYELSLIIQTSKDEEKVNSAKEELIEGGLLLVVSRANKIHKNTPNTPLMDLIAEGNIALMSAVNKYDVRLENSALFSTFAVKLIDQKIYQFIRLNRLVHIPEHHFYTFSKIRKLEDVTKGNMTDEDIMEECEMSEGTLEGVKDAYLMQRVMSLEELVTDEDMRWEDFIPDEKENDASSLANLKTLKEHLDKQIDKLTTKEREAIKVMFLDGETRSYHSTAKILNCTAENVRQLCRRAFSRLRVAIEFDYVSKIYKKQEDADETIDNIKRIPIAERYEKYIQRGLSYSQMVNREKLYKQNIREQEEEAEKIRRRHSEDEPTDVEIFEKNRVKHIMNDLI